MNGRTGSVIKRALLAPLPARWWGNEKASTRGFGVNSNRLVWPNTAQMALEMTNQPCVSFRASWAAYKISSSPTTTCTGMSSVRVEGLRAARQPKRSARASAARRPSFGVQKTVVRALFDRAHPTGT